MIIKKSKQQINKNKTVPPPPPQEEPVNVPLIEETQQTEETFQSEVETEPETVVDSQSSIVQEPEPEIEEVETEKEPEKVDIFAEFDFDNINYSQRAERRRGDRRRGFRRIDDRNLISRAQQEAINIKEQASREGFEKGLADANDAIEGLKNSINEFFEYKEIMQQKVTEDYLELSIKIAEKIIKKEVETDKKVLEALIQDAIGSLAKDENKIILKVNPTDVEYTKEIVPKLLSSGQFEAKIFVSGNKEVDEGSVIIETSNGVIDATIGTQLEIIKEAFKQI